MLGVLIAFKSKQHSSGGGAGKKALKKALIFWPHINQAKPASASNVSSHRKTSSARWPLWQTIGI